MRALKILLLSLAAGALSQGGCGCASTANGKCADPKVAQAKMTVRGRPAHVCGCRELGYDEAGAPVVKVDPCLDEPIRPPEASTPTAKDRYPTKLRCATACDLRADVGEKDCKELNRAEAEILRAYAEGVPEFRPAYASCMALAGWTVSIHKRVDADDQCKAGGWWAPPHKCVIGLTRYERGDMELEDADWMNNGLTHEIGHVLDREYGTEVFGQHCGWKQRGLFHVIYEVTGERDGSPEECE